MVDLDPASSAYFGRLSAALNWAGVAQPVLIIDRVRLEANVAAVKATLAGSGLAVRVVVKSLPAPGLIDAVVAGLGTDRLMVFNAPMLIDVARAWPNADVLMGKPLSVGAAAQFYDATDGRVAPQWLIDTPTRLNQYAALAAARGVPLRVSLEIDVGLHRGGFATPAALSDAIDLAASLRNVEVCGLMGYDPHVAKVPDRSRAFDRVQAHYRAAVAVLEAKLPGDPARFVLNTAGSPTYRLHAIATVANEVSIGSAFVKPTDFDLDTLSHHIPAAFIATPVLKALDRPLVPSLERLAGLFALLDPGAARAFFIHGGNWMANPVFPAGLEYSRLFGRSSNQELLTAPTSVALEPDDMVFLRPAQSEAVLLQFGNLMMFDGSQITAYWPTFSISA